MTVLTDLTRAARRLRRSPGATLLGVLILALALGASGALVAVVRATLLAPLPYDHPEAIVALWETNRPHHADHNVVRPGNFLEWRDRARSFSDLAVYTWASAVFTGEGQPERVRGRAVSPNLFGLLGVRPAAGRGFEERDVAPGAAHTMVLSWGLWQRRFGGRADAIGKIVETEDGSAEIVGVMPKTMLPLGAEEYWEPFRLDPVMRTRGGRYTMVLARLAPGVTLAQAQEEMTRIGGDLEREF
ncbi:MAG: ABC transporter permease, partial [Gemmatimonadales bacterium]